MMDDWKKICEMAEDCEGCPLEDFCAQKPKYWDIDKLYDVINEVLYGDE
jgi:hypothetical protein